MKGRRIRPYSPPIRILSPFGRRAYLSNHLPVRLVPEKGLLLLSSALGGIASRCFHRQTSREAARDIQVSAGAELFLTFALATRFLCDAACSTTLGVLTERLIAPLWQRLRKGRRTGGTTLVGEFRSLRELVCTSSLSDKNSRPSRCIYISHNPPPHIPSLFTRSCI